MSSIKIISWNVNGIRAIIKKDFLRDINEIDPDIICLQETKAGEEDALKALSVLDGYGYHVNSSKAKKGYSGTAILSKKSPSKISNDIGVFEHDQEGRVIKAEFESFNLINVYVPNSGQELKRLDYRKKWVQILYPFKLSSFLCKKNTQKIVPRRFLHLKNNILLWFLLIFFQTFTLSQFCCFLS